MIVIDIPMPARCWLCPCMYAVNGGPDDGLPVCGAAEWRDQAKGKKQKPEAYMVECHKDYRPEDCPIIGEVVTE